MKLLSIVVLILFSFSSRAQIFRGPQSSALGGTGRAGLSSSEGAFLNPALVPLIAGYEGQAYFRDGDIGPGQHRHTMGLGLSDNGQEVMFAGNLTYLRVHDTGLAATPVDGDIWHAAIGKAFAQRFSMGASVYRAQYMVLNDRRYTQWNYSLGGIWLPLPKLAVAYVISNLAHPGSDTPRALRQDTAQGFGANWELYDFVRLRADVARQEMFNPKHRLNYGVGFESMTSDFIVMRVGCHRDELADTRIWTAGFGFNGPRLKVDYSFEKNEERTSGALHSVDMTLPF